MLLIMICPRSATVLLGMNKNLNILKTNILDLDILSNPLLDFLKICIRCFFLGKRGEFLNFTTMIGYILTVKVIMLAV